MMNALAFQIRLVQPVLAGQVQSGEANSTVTYPFIPGSMLRGALATHHPDGKSTGIQPGTPFFDLFFGGKVRFLNAYPVYPEGNTRMLPRPLSWFVHKADIHNQTSTIYDFAVLNTITDETYKPPAGDFFWSGTQTVKLTSPQIDLTVHNASTDRNRKKGGTSQVYRYDALSADQVFGAVIISEDVDLLKSIKIILDTHDLLLGGSSNGGYGKAEIIRPVYIDTNWNEDEEFHQTISETASDRVSLTCLSDLILRKAKGEFDFDLETLAGPKPLKLFRRVRLVGGFNRKWGLPLTQDWAIEAGSVFVFPAECRSKLESMIDCGVGERLTEGYGRVALDFHTQAELVRTEMPQWPIIVPSHPEELTGMSHNYAQAIARRKLENELGKILTQQIDQLTTAKDTFKGLPKTAQLSRARLAARADWQAKIGPSATPELSHLKQHFDGLSERSRRTWKDARLNDASLLDWILKRVEKPFEEPFDAGEVQFARVSARFTPELRSKTVARLIEGVLKQAVEIAKKEGRTS